jgi:hypothetical protein
MASLEATRFNFGYPVGLVYTCHIIFQIFTFFLVVILFIVFLFTQTLPKIVFGCSSLSYVTPLMYDYYISKTVYGAL